MIRCPCQPPAESAGRSRNDRPCSGETGHRNLETPLTSTQPNPIAGAWLVRNFGPPQRRTSSSFRRESSEGRNVAQVRTRLRRMQYRYRPALLNAFLARTRLDLTPSVTPKSKIVSRVRGCDSVGNGELLSKAAMSARMMSYLASQLEDHCHRMSPQLGRNQGELIVRFYDILLGQNAIVRRSSRIELHARTRRASR